MDIALNGRPIDAALMRLGNQLVKIVDRAVRRVDFGVIGNVVAVINLR